MQTFLPLLFSKHPVFPWELGPVAAVGRGASFSVCWLSDIKILTVPSRQSRAAVHAVAIHVFHPWVLEPKTSELAELSVTEMGVGC